MSYNITQRMLCAAEHTYRITSSAQTLQPDTIDGLPHSSCVGYRGSIDARQSIGSGIDAALVGTIDEGIVVALRGTLSPDDDTRPFLEVFHDWKNNAGITLKAATYGQAPNRQTFPGKVHELYAKSFARLWPAILGLVTQRVAAAAPRIYVTGHSKGGALAVLCGWALTKAFPNHSVIVRTFAAPRAVDPVFALAYDRDVPNHIRFEYDNDIVPHLPFRTSLLGELGLPPLLVAAFISKDPGYGDVGKLCYIDAKGVCAAGTPALQTIRYAKLIAHLVTPPLDLTFVKECHVLSPGYASGHYGPPPPPGGLPAGMPDDVP